MKFGKLDHVDGLEFVLPEDHPTTLPTLGGKRAADPKIFMGGTMWTIKDWKGKIYPEKTTIKNFPLAYCSQFSTIELNATHYKIYSSETIVKWKAFAKKGFEFCPKWPQLISHYRRFNNSNGITDEFLEAIVNFQELLGPCFIQLPPNFSTREAEKLRNYLLTIPRDIRVALEFRHPDWFTEDLEAQKTWNLMHERGINAVISATAGRRDAVHMRLTGRHFILRFGGYEMHKSDLQRMDDWADRAAFWIENGLETFYVFMHQPNSILTPEACIYFADKLKEKTGLEVKKPALVSKQGELF